MTPKEKVLELIIKFYYTGIDEYSCKQCALIAVNELIEYSVTHSMSNYWKDVKQEIENL
jgi:hypothetical protein